MLDEKELKELKDLLKDAESCHRLSQFEEEFCADFRVRVETYGDSTRISDRQREVLRQIEAKVYA